jgi:hypothetical protein
MDPALERLEGPTAELLIDVRTPAELTFSPDASRLAFALHCISGIRRIEAIALGRSGGVPMVLRRLR